MKLLIQSLSLMELKAMAQTKFGNLVKAVVDLDKNLIVVDAEMHADEEQYLLNNGSRQSSLWGINLYPEKFGQPEFVEFDSMINLRPSQNNFSRGIKDKKIKRQIIYLVSQWIKV